MEKECFKARNWHNCLSMRKKTLFGNPNFVSGDLFTGASRHKATWEKIQLGALLCKKCFVKAFGMVQNNSEHLFV